MSEEYPAAGPRGRVPGESSTMLRFESIADRLGEIAMRLETMDVRARESELHNREQLVELRGSFANLREMFERTTRDQDSFRAELRIAVARIEVLERFDTRDVEQHDRRIAELEKSEHKREGGALVAVGGGAASGGILYGLIELARRLWGGG